MNKTLVRDFMSLRPSDVTVIQRELAMPLAQYPHESNVIFFKRYLTHVENEGRIRELEQLVVQLA